MDRRVQKTRQALQESLIALILEKGYESLTVQDVLDHANVGRSTFYAHFYDLDDLLESEFEALRSEFEQHINRQTNSASSIWDISRLMFQHAQSYQHLYKAVVGKASGQLIQSHLHKYLSIQFREILKRDGTGIKNELVSPELLEHYLVSSFMALLSWWLDKNSAHSAEQMAQIYQDLTQDGFKNLWR
jgi:AcrR family transcriptional regulator